MDKVQPLLKEESSRVFSNIQDGGKDKSDGSIGVLKRRLSQLESKERISRIQETEPLKSTPPQQQQQGQTQPQPQPQPLHSQHRSQLKRDGLVSPVGRSGLEGIASTHAQKKRLRLNFFEYLEISEDSDKKLESNENEINADALGGHETETTPTQTTSKTSVKEETPPTTTKGKTQTGPPEGNLHSTVKKAEGRHIGVKNETGGKREGAGERDDEMSGVDDVSDDMEVSDGRPMMHEVNFFTKEREQTALADKMLEHKGARRELRVVPFPSELREEHSEKTRTKEERTVHHNGSGGNNGGRGEASNRRKSSFTYVTNRFSGTNGTRKLSPGSEQQQQQQQQQQQRQRQQGFSTNKQQQQQTPKVIGGGQQTYTIQQLQQQLPQPTQPQLQPPQPPQPPLQQQPQQQTPQIISGGRMYPIQQQTPQQFYGLPAIQQRGQVFFPGMPQQFFGPGIGMMIPQQTQSGKPGAEAGYHRFVERIRDYHVKVINGNPYLKLSRIGSGASSRVYKVMGLDFKTYALKRVSWKAIGMDKVQEEIGLMQKLKGNPLVIQIIEHQFIGNKVYIVMELGETDLSKLLMASQGKDIDMNVIRVYWQQMLRSVNAVHDADIIHADLKPQNFVLVNGTWKLIDFGISKEMHQDSTHVTMGIGIGTPNYLSPEVLNYGKVAGNKARVTKAADTWSLGCILYQMVFGKTPFQSFVGMDKYIAIVNAKEVIHIPPEGCSEDLKARLPGSLVDVLRGCLQRDPKMRPTIRQLLRHPFLTGNTFCPHCSHCAASASTDDGSDEEEEQEGQGRGETSGRIRS